MRYTNLKPEISNCKPKTILEIGTWDGGHSCEMIMEAKKYNEDVVYFGFDIFENIDEDIRKKELHVKSIQNEGRVRERIERTGAEVHLHVGYTNETLPKFDAVSSVDFAYIDGGHSLETIDNDWLYVEKLMHDDTVVIFDDYYDSDTTKGCYNLIQKLISEDKYKVQLLDPEDSFPGLRIRFVKVTKA